MEEKKPLSVADIFNADWQMPGINGFEDEESDPFLDPAMMGGASDNLEDSKPVEEKVVKAKKVKKVKVEVLRTSMEIFPNLKLPPWLHGFS